MGGLAAAAGEIRGAGQAWAQTPEAPIEATLAGLKLAPGFAIEIYARVPAARSIAVAEEIQTIFVSTRGEVLYGLHAGELSILAEDLKAGNGIAWRAPYLYLAEQHRLSRFRFDAFQKDLPPAERLFEELPDKAWHGWRYLALHPTQERLLVGVGAPCNICHPQGLEGTILEFTGDFTQPTVFARGVRNSVGMDFAPWDGSVYFTDNGADFLGDDLPPDELNHAPRAGEHFGFPFYAGGQILSEPEQTLRREDGAADQEPLQELQFPIYEFRAHNAPLGLHFYRGTRLSSLTNRAVVALHGSWNRTEPDGYKILVLPFSPTGQPGRAYSLVDGFLTMPGRRGRPVDIKTHWDGTLLVSDDSRGVLYRILEAN